MIVTIAVASGVAHLYMIWFIAVLMWCTQCFGYYTEVTSPPESLGDNKKPTRWLLNNDNPHLLLFPELPAVFQRLAPHFLGYIPYLTVWIVLMHSFFYNVSGGDGGPPFFVYLIVVGQLFVFTGFGFTQLFNQGRLDGPSWYYWGEWSYLALSLFSKGLLGMTLVANVMLYDSFDEAVAAAE